MLKFVAGIFIISFAVCIASEEISSEEISSEEKRDPDVLPISQDLPLILIKKEYDELALPTSVKIIKKWYQRQKKIRFTSFVHDKQVFYCPAENETQERKIKAAKEVFDSNPNRVGDGIDDTCLFKKKKSNKKKTMFPECEKQPEPRIMIDLEVKQNTQKLVPVACGPNKEGKNLIFGYQLCEEYEGIITKLIYRISDKKQINPFRVINLNMYEICYDAEKTEILHTSHVIMAPLLLKHYLLEDERSKYPAKNMATNELLHMSNIDFNEVKTELEEIEEGDKFKIQMLIPLEDFPFVIWKKPVYHFVNASLIHKELEKCWNSIHDKIRKNAIRRVRHLEILTKAFRYVDSSFGKTWNYEEKSERIPSLWVKLVYHDNFYTRETKAVAIIANNYRDDIVDAIISKKLKCDSNLCWKRKVTKHSAECDKIGRDIRCCEVNKEIKQLFGFTETYKIVLLDIVGLIVGNPKPLTAPPTAPTASPFNRSKTSPPRSNKNGTLKSSQL